MRWQYGCYVDLAFVERSQDLDPEGFEQLIDRYLAYLRENPTPKQLPLHADWYFTDALFDENYPGLCLTLKINAYGKTRDEARGAGARHVDHWAEFFAASA